MLGKKIRDNGAIRTIIGADIRIYGDLQFVGCALIDGFVKGNVRGSGDEGNSTLIISARGRIEGSVVVPHLVLNGTVEGQVCVSEHVELGPKAKVMGDMQYGLLQMAMGAKVNGRLIHEGEAPAVEEDAEAAPEMEAVSHG
jgi:cytoskeletal protein CcmA (bactofilin family)